MSVSFDNGKWFVSMLRFISELDKVDKAKQEQTINRAGFVSPMMSKLWHEAICIAFIKEHVFLIK